MYKNKKEMRKIGQTKKAKKKRRAKAEDKTPPCMQTKHSLCSTSGPSGTGQAQSPTEIHPNIDFKGDFHYGFPFSQKICLTQHVFNFPAVPGKASR